MSPKKVNMKDCTLPVLLNFVTILSVPQTIGGLPVAKRAPDDRNRRRLALISVT